MKNLIIIFTVLSMSACNTLHKLTGANLTPTAQVQTPAHYTVSGQTSSNTDYVTVRTESSDITVKVLRPGQTDWVALNRYEFNVLNGSILFRHQVTVTPSGQLTFAIPEVPSAPTGTKYEISSTLQDQGHSLY